LVSLPADREGRLVAPSDQVGVGERAGGPRPVVDPGRCQLGVQKVVDPDRPHADVAAVVARGRGETEADVERWTPAAVLEREHHPAGTLGRLVLLSAAEPVERQEREDDRALCSPLEGPAITVGLPRLPDGEYGDHRRDDGDDEGEEAADVHGGRV
jgi:hypothetical protein